MGRPKGAKDKKPRVMPKTGEARGITKTHNPDLEEGYNTTTIQFMMECMNDTLQDLNDVEEMEKRFLNYLKICMKYDKKPGNMGAYASIGISKEQAWEWVNKSTKLNPARSDFIKKVQKVCSFYRENLMLDGKINPVTGIFWQKNYDGMKDQQEVVVTPNNPMGDAESPERLEQKYLDAAYSRPQIEQNSTRIAEGEIISEKVAERVAVGRRTESSDF